MISSITKRPSAPRRRLCELVGRADGLHELHDKSRLTIRLVARDGAQRSIRADRTRYFSFAGLLPGEYDLHCAGVFGGVFNDIHVGSIGVDRGVNAVQASLSGCAVRGSVAVLERPVPVGSVMELRRADGSGVAHKSLLDTFGRFFFSALRPGAYVLSGHVPGQGWIDAVEVATNGSEVRTGVVALRAVPRVRIRLRGPRGGWLARGYRIVVHGPQGATIADAAARIDAGWLVERPSGAGARYRIEVLGGAAVDGEAKSPEAVPVADFVARRRGTPRARRVVDVRWG